MRGPAIAKSRVVDPVNLPGEPEGLIRQRHPDCMTQVVMVAAGNRSGELLYIPLFVVLDPKEDLNHSPCNYEFFT